MGLTQTDIDEISIAFDRNGALNNVEIREAFQKILDGGSGAASGVYIANLSQTGTSAPTDNELVNTLGSGTWSYLGVGNYRYTLVGAFTDQANVVVTTSPYQFDGTACLFYALPVESNDFIDFFVVDVDTPLTGVNDLMFQTPIKIEVY